ncbi:GtrA family protein [Streptomyces sp. NPDC054962]
MKSLTSFARFVVFGGGTGVLSSLAVPLLAVLMPWTLSNALVTLASTVLCTELHARYTFRTGRHAGLRRHWQSAGSAAAAYAATSVAVFALHAVQPTPGMLTEQLVYLSASGLAGTGRFVILRLFVFVTGTDHETADPAKTADTNLPTKATTIPRPRRTPVTTGGLTTALSPS